MKFLLSLVVLTISASSLASNFTACQDANDFSELKQSQCRYVESPLLHTAKDDQTIKLFVRKFPASEKRQGSLWLIAGGPGESGSSFYPIIRYFQQSFPALDIFVPDHRGTGASTTICKEESPQSTAGTSLVGEEWGQCFGFMYSNPDYVKAFSITNAAKDLKQLISQYSGEGKRYVYGVSYGTQLVLRLLQLEELQLDGVILDSLIPHQLNNQYDLSHRSQVVNNVGLELLALHQTPTKTNQKKGASLKEQLAHVLKNPQSLNSDSQKWTRNKLSLTLGSMLDVPSVRNTLPQLIEQLSEGKTSLLLDGQSKLNKYYKNLSKDYFNKGYSIPLAQVIIASENNLRPKQTKQDIEKESQSLLFTSPLPGLIAENSLPTYAKDQYFAKQPKQIPPMLVLHGTLDPKTHYRAAELHIQKLRQTGSVRLITIKQAPHFIALTATKCFQQWTKQFVAKQITQDAECIENAALVNFHP
ncbi:alpha/beta fold hydrolase [Pleionea sp. CnH1-48]|uniref:alpha/beta fold hydrolase n=1 Tax=Pleionea sp. CnH1-48 TaxID=2954494 RepID=UPI002098079B|nr:alpha/beta fold hydrolase [Pleionea sp. CnH1-48]MCO7227371.1 alpha/beta fold hydrolase [Pleionea sp. CnH1-48]